MTGVQQVSARVEELLDALQSGGFGARGCRPPRNWSRLLVGLYGDGLGRDHGGPGRAGPAGRGDAWRSWPTTRWWRACCCCTICTRSTSTPGSSARSTGSGPTSARTPAACEYLGVDDGVARLRLEGSCHGCPSSTVTVQLAITRRGAGRRARGHRGRRRGHDRAPPEPRPAADRQRRPTGGSGPTWRGRRQAGTRGRLGHAAGHRAAELAAGRARRPPGSRCWSARSAARCTPTGTPARPADPRWPTASSTARS